MASTNIEALSCGKQERRDDILPVIVGGDIGAYALGVEFHLAYGVRSVCVASGPIAVIAHSSIFDLHHVERTDAAGVLGAVEEISRNNPGKKLILIGNRDDVIHAINDLSGRLPDNVLTSVPSGDQVRFVSDKIKFQGLCEQCGVDVARTEIVSLAGDEPIAPSAFAFPLVAKPALPAEYYRYFAQGFSKVYFMRSQQELDDLWRDLRAAGFAGEFLVQELIEGDDTNIGCLTTYVSSKGKVTMLAGAQVLLEDHAPTLLGNPVAMISRPMPEVWEKMERLVGAIGYRGFCNFDVKVDARTGKTIFMDMNPRIGRGSYYIVAGGTNPMRCLVSDLLGEDDDTQARTTRAGLYTLVPLRLLKRYVNEDLRAEIDQLASQGLVFDPQRYPRDNGLAKRAYVMATELNQYRKFARYYPEPTHTSF